MSIIVKTVKDGARHEQQNWSRLGGIGIRRSKRLRVNER